jgi:hypothetical protein
LMAEQDACLGRRRTVGKACLQSTGRCRRRLREASNLVDKGAMDDRNVYLKLAAVAEELMVLSEAAETYVGEAALRTAASTIAGTAKAVYEQVMGSDDAH